MHETPHPDSSAKYTMLRRTLYSPVFAKNTPVSRIFGENFSKISAGRGILGKDERVERVLSGIGKARGLSADCGFDVSLQ